MDVWREGEEGDMDGWRECKVELGREGGRGRWDAGREGGRCQTLSVV